MNNLFNDAQSLWVCGVWFGVLGFSSLDDFRSKSLEAGMLSMTSVSFSWSSNQLVVVGAVIYSRGATQHDKT